MTIKLQVKTLNVGELKAKAEGLVGEKKTAVLDVLNNASGDNIAVSLLKVKLKNILGADEINTMATPGAVFLLARPELRAREPIVETAPSETQATVADHPMLRAQTLPYKIDPIDLFSDPAPASDVASFAIPETYQPTKDELALVVRDIKEGRLTQETYDALRVVSGKTREEAREIIDRGMERYVSDYLNTVQDMALVASGLAIAVQMIAKYDNFAADQEKIANYKASFGIQMIKMQRETELAARIPKPAVVPHVQEAAVPNPIETKPAEAAPVESINAARTAVRDVWTNDDAAPEAAAGVPNLELPEFKPLEGLQQESAKPAEKPAEAVPKPAEAPVKPTTVEGVAARVVEILEKDNTTLGDISAEFDNTPLNFEGTAKGLHTYIINQMKKGKDQHEVRNKLCAGRGAIECTMLERAFDHFLDYSPELRALMFAQTKPYHFTDAQAKDYSASGQMPPAAEKKEPAPKAVSEVKPPPLPPPMPKKVPVAAAPILTSKVAKPPPIPAVDPTKRQMPLAENDPKLLADSLKGLILNNASISEMEKLISKGADVNHVKNEGDKTLLMLAIVKRNHDAVKLLLAKDANVNAVNKNGMTALMYAAMTGEVEDLKQLDMKGANMEAVDKEGRTTLMIAARNGNANAAEYLIVEKKVNVNAKDKTGMTTLMRSAAEAQTYITNLLLHNKANNTANVNEVDVTESSALHYAAKNVKSVDVGRRLLAKGAKVNATDKDGRTAAMYAATNGYDSFLKLLVENNADIDIIDKEGGVAIMDAAHDYNISTVKILLANNSRFPTEFEQHPELWRVNPDLKVQSMRKPNDEIAKAFCDFAMKKQKKIFEGASYRREHRKLVKAMNKMKEKQTRELEEFKQQLVPQAKPKTILAKTVGVVSGISRTAGALIGVGSFLIAGASVYTGVNYNDEIKAYAVQKFNDIRNYQFGWRTAVEQRPSTDEEKFSQVFEDRLTTMDDGKTNERLKEIIKRLPDVKLTGQKPEDLLVERFSR